MQWKVSPLCQSAGTTQSSEFLTDGSFNVTTERSPTVSAMDQDTIKQLLVELCFYPLLFLFVSQAFFLPYSLSSPLVHSSPYSWSKTDMQTASGYSAGCKILFKR